jgi:mycothiol synthase
VPPGYELTTLKQFGDLRAVYRAYDESFRDHWGHVDRPEEVGFREFAHHIEEPDFDPELWLLLVEEETNEITAVGLCSPKSEENPTIGHVDILGVRRPWRRQGQGLLLLHQIFALFQQKGTYKQVALNVDAQSLTGATRLYERAGMRIERTYLIYEKVLQHGRDLSVTAVPEIKTGETS